MAFNKIQFKAPPAPPRSAGTGELPVELLVTVAGGLVLFLIVLFMIWRRMNRADRVPDV